MAANCEGAEHVYSWPKDLLRKRKWTAFVTQKVVNFAFKTNSVLCFRHFSPKCFSNLSHYKLMPESPIWYFLNTFIILLSSCPSVMKYAFQCRLVLLPTAVSTIQLLPGEASTIDIPRKQATYQSLSKKTRQSLL